MWYNYSIIYYLFRIYKEERSRVLILEDQTVNPSLLYINPVRLDGRDTEYAFCARYISLQITFIYESHNYCISSTPFRCNTFLPKFHAVEDTHRCPRGYQAQDMGKVNGTNY